ncbi:MAG: HepT-like ribonuclease domain-containing protein [Phycisphaerae bacterium]
MRLEARKYLADMLDAADAIRGYVGGLTLEAYCNDRKTRAAVERELEVIGEAAGQLAKIDLPTANRLGPHRKMTNLRNALIHRYWAVEHPVVWGILEHHLPLLRDAVAELLKEDAP